MPNPTRARAAQYLVDPFVPTRDTLPCEHCGTTLSNCDWFPDALGRLFPRCPNARRHGTGWRAHPEPPEVPPYPTHCEDCEQPMPQNGTGRYRFRCHECARKREQAQKAAWYQVFKDRRAESRRQREIREARADRLRAYWQGKHNAV